MRTQRLTTIVPAIGLALVLGVTAHADSVPPIRPEQAPAPATPAPHAAKGKHTDPTDAVAQCKDGSYSHAKHRSHACAKRGGVAKWLDGAKE